MKDFFSKVVIFFICFGLICLFCLSLDKMPSYASINFALNEFTRDNQAHYLAFYNAVTHLHEQFVLIAEADDVYGEFLNYNPDGSYGDYLFFYGTDIDSYIPSDANFTESESINSILRVIFQLMHWGMDCMYRIYTICATIIGFIPILFTFIFEIVPTAVTLGFDLLFSILDLPFDILQYEESLQM